MTKRVHEIMNHERFTVGPQERAADVRMYLWALGITAAPVVDDAHRAVGWISSRDLARVDDDRPVSECMTSPADSIGPEASARDAAERMTALRRHHLAVVDPSGRVLGFVGTLDVLSGMLGKPAVHPGTFAHDDPSPVVWWTEALPLDERNVTHAPDGPGLLRLIESRPGVPDRVVASEARWNVRTRLLDLLSLPQPELPKLEEAVGDRTLRFRAASTSAPGPTARPRR